MAIYLQNEKDYENLIQNGKVLVDFYADWCGPCQMLGPVLEEAQNTVEFTLLKINVDEFPNIARRYGIMSIPTIILFKDGELIKKDLGYKPLPAIINFLKD
ncbi:MAG: thioredoxin [Bacillales bacterium]|nr:thioredoxin [Bacillales bacterium]MDY6002979.1 thioredoxin [Bacilli bacterium]